MYFCRQNNNKSIGWCNFGKVFFWNGKLIYIDMFTENTKYDSLGTWARIKNITLTARTRNFMARINIYTNSTQDKHS